jgi:hypothetical protein
MRAHYASPEGMPQPERREERKSEFERQRDERYERCLQSLRDALVVIERAASR